tara:strand:- start:64 stop:420 length:357 start_codon:yes stop_codon:yes gene_type:complete
MATILRTGYERTSRVRLPEGKTTLNAKKPLQAAVTGTLIRVARNCSSMEDVGNLLTLAQNVDTTDGNVGPKEKIGTEETYHLVDKAGKVTKTMDPNVLSTLLGNGWTLDRTESVDVMG